MSTTVNKLSYLSDTKSAIKTALINQGVAVSDSDTFRSYADKIGEIVSSVGLNYESIKKINDNWKFYNITTSSTSNTYDSTTAQTALADTDSFTDVTLPHDWSIYLDFNSSSKGTYEGGYLDGGDSWYTREITLSSDDSDKRVFLWFEGIYMESDILINGTHVLAHKNGYTPFLVEITDYITFGSVNTLAIYVKNRQPSSRWYSGSGIERDVYLITTNKVAIKQQGVKVTTPDLENEYADYNYGTANIDIALENLLTDSQTGIIKNTIKFGGQEICSKSETVTLASGETSYSCSLVVNDPKLWGVHEGNYYELITELTVSGEIVSICNTYFGFRYIKWDADTGFYLNGKRTFLRGMCMHSDLGALGMEVNQSAINRQLRILKDMGCNAIRLTHNASSPQFLNACMKMGFIAIEEAFDCWEDKKKTYDYARFFSEYAESDLKNMVKRGINNPAIIMWSIGNEVYDTNSSCTTDTDGDGVYDSVDTVKQLVSWVKEVDTTRPTTMGENKPKSAVALAVIQEVDVAGLNYSPAYYATWHTNYPTLPIYGSEQTSALSSRGKYSRDDTNYYCSSYDDDKVSWGAYAYSALSAAVGKSYVGGYFVWTGFDYIGEPTPFNKYPAKSSYFGAIDTCGFPKDIFYMYQSQWNDTPMCHICPMDWDSWTVDEDVTVMVYANAASVKLYLNGTLLGSVASSAKSKYAFNFTVPFAKGKLVANAYDSDGNLIAQDIVQTSHLVTGVKLSCDKRSVGKGSDELLFFEADIIDSEGIFCATAENIITFNVTGGAIVGVDNGHGASIERYKNTNQRSAFSGKALCIVKPDGTSDKVTLTASIENGTIEGNCVVAQVNGGDTILYKDNTSEFIDATETYEYIEETHPCTLLTLNQTELTLTDTTSVTLTATIEPTNTTDTLIWSTDDSSVAIVSNGVVTAVNDGTATITATCGELTATCTVTVSGITVTCTGVTLSETELTLTDTAQHDITATVTPNDCTQEVSWASSDDSIVTVTGGHVTAIGNGTATITATCGNYSAVCNVVVALDDSIIMWNGTSTIDESLFTLSNTEIVAQDDGSYALMNATTNTIGVISIPSATGTAGQLDVYVEYDSSQTESASYYNFGLNGLGNTYWLAGGIDWATSTGLVCYQNGSSKVNTEKTVSNGSTVKLSVIVPSTTIDGSTSKGTFIYTDSDGNATSYTITKNENTSSSVSANTCVWTFNKKYKIKRIVWMPETTDDSDSDVTLSSISATYDGTEISVSSGIDGVKSALTVTGTYSDGSTATITDYTVSGTAEAGTQTLTITYSELTTAIDVTFVDDSGSNDDDVEATSIVWEGTETYDSSVIILDGVSIVADSTDEGTYVMTKSVTENSMSTTGYITLPNTGAMSGTFEIIYKVDSSLLPSNASSLSKSVWKFGLATYPEAGQRCCLYSKSTIGTTFGMYKESSSATINSSCAVDTWYRARINMIDGTYTYSHSAEDAEYTAKTISTSTNTEHDCCYLWISLNGFVVKSIKWTPASEGGK